VEIRAAGEDGSDAIAERSAVHSVGLAMKKGGPEEPPFRRAIAIETA
jgi:hypothetical protein